MDSTLTNFWVLNLDVAIFFYGLAFLLMGFGILFQIRIAKRSSFQLFDILWILALFGIIHGINQFIEMFSLIKQSNFLFRFSDAATLIASFALLFIFGYKLLNIAKVKLFNIWFPAIMCFLFILLPAIYGFRSYFVWIISSRYNLGFTGGILCSIGMLLYYRSESKKLKKYDIFGNFLLASITFAAFAFFAGFIVPERHIFPSSIINSKQLFAIIRVPVQVFRTICAFGLAYSIRNIVEIFVKEDEERYFAKEKLILDSERKLRNLMKSVPMGVGISDPEGSITDANQGLWKMFSYNSREDFIMINFNSLFYKESDKIKFLDLLSKNATINNFEVQFKRKDNSVFWGSINSTTHTTDLWGTQFISTIMDVTERRKAEEEIYKLMTAVEYSNEIIFMTDKNQLITYINPEFSKVYNYRKSEIVGIATPKILKGEILSPQNFASFWETLSEKNSIRAIFINHTKDGKKVKVEGATNPILDEDGSVIGYLEIQHKLEDVA